MCCFLLSPASLVASSGQRHLATDRFVRGIVVLARQGRIHDPRGFTRLTGIVLRNPDKWTAQREAGRTARWANPQNRTGIVEVAFGDILTGDRSKISFTASIELSGTPCVTIRQVVRASGARPSYGGLVMSSVTDGGPVPPPHRLGREHASVSIAGPGGLTTSIDMDATGPGPRACVRSIVMESERPPAAADARDRP